MKPAISMVLVGALLHAGLAPSQEQHSHPVPEKLGTVVFATTCAPRVARGVERAVALLHSFAYDAAHDAFLKVAAADPTCAMAHWGVAMSNYHQLWSPPAEAELREGQTEINRALALHARTLRERQLIDAAAAFYAHFEQAPHPLRAKAYADAMRLAAQANPKDTEVQIFYALALLSVAAPEDRTHAHQKRAAAILEPIYRDKPDHPGAAHYLIHAYDSSELAPRGLAAARAYSKIAPAAPHALHMPSHIFTRLGLWDDSIASNSAARATAHAQGDVGEELHAMDYLVYADLQRGRQRDAEQVVQALATMQGLHSTDFKVGYSETAMPIRLDMEGHHWESAITRQPVPGSAPEIAALVYWARAVANARAGHPQATENDIAQIDACRIQLQSSGKAYWANLVGVLGMEASAWTLAARSRGDEAVALLTRAADDEDRVEKLPVTPGPIVPAREQLGDLLLELNQPKEALQAYQAALLSAPGRRGALTGGAHAAELVGDTRTSEEMQARLRR